MYSIVTSEELNLYNNENTIKDKASFKVEKINDDVSFVKLTEWGDSDLFFDIEGFKLEEVISITKFLDIGKKFSIVPSIIILVKGTLGESICHGLFQVNNDDFNENGSYQLTHENLLGFTYGTDQRPIVKVAKRGKYVYTDLPFYNPFDGYDTVISVDGLEPVDLILSLDIDEFTNSELMEIVLNSTGLNSQEVLKDKIVILKMYEEMPVGSEDNIIFKLVYRVVVPIERMDNIVIYNGTIATIGKEVKIDDLIGCSYKTHINLTPTKLEKKYKDIDNIDLMVSKEKVYISL